VSTSRGVRRCTGRARTNSRGAKIRRPDDGVLPKEAIKGEKSGLIGKGRNRREAVIQRKGEDGERPFRHFGERPPKGGIDGGKVKGKRLLTGGRDEWIQNWTEMGEGR